MPRKTKADWEAEVAAAYQNGLTRGREEGVMKERSTYSSEVARAKLQLLSGIGQTIQACAQLADNIGALTH